MQKILLTDGCPNKCSYCYEPLREVKFYPVPEISDKEVQILDMNFLSNPNSLEILKNLPKAKYEFVCGIDFRRLTQEICNLMKKKRFIKVRWAWDYGFSQQRVHNKIWKMFKKAGYRNEDLSVFVLVNWKIPFSECCMKLDLLKIWNVKVDDCCYDGGYPKSEIDFNNNPRFNDKRFWKYENIKKFRKMSRSHNLMVLFKIHPDKP